MAKEIREDFADLGEQMVQAVADTERLRETEPYPQPMWRAAWQRRSDLLAQFVDLARRAAIANNTSAAA